MVGSEHVAVQWKPAELAGLLSPFEKAAAASAVPTLCNCEPQKMVMSAPEGLALWLRGGVHLTINNNKIAC